MGRMIGGYLMLVVLGCMSFPSAAVSLRKNKVTDDSVCDLAPNTNEVLARQALVPAQMSDDLQVAAYERLARRWIATSCAQGQQLVLHSPGGDRVDERSLTNLANSLCTAAAVTRVATLSRSAATGVEKRGLEIRCIISKYDNFRAAFLEAEASQSTEAYLQQLRAGLGPAPKEAASSAPRASAECPKMNAAGVLVGGPCR
jgi:hypothetical protein